MEALRRTFPFCVHFEYLAYDGGTCKLHDGMLHNFVGLKVVRRILKDLLPSCLSVCPSVNNLVSTFSSVYICLQLNQTSSYLA